MKNLYYTFALIIFLTSCRSIDKMVEAGNYEEAFRFGVDKLRGKKNKKTKYVKGLERAFNKLEARDIADIRLNKKRRDIYSLELAIDGYERLIARQEYISPLLPLYSKNGYYANIELKDYSSAIIDLEKSIYQLKLDKAEHHYTKGLELLIGARETRNKGTAMAAHNQFDRVLDNISDYKNARTLRREAHSIGIKRILIEPFVAGSNIAFDHAMEIISLFNTSTVNSYWKKFYTTDENISIDYIATVEIGEIYPGRETERINTFTQTVKVSNGMKPRKGRDGKHLVDTLGRKLYKEKYKDVFADITEIVREKRGSMTGRITVINAKNNSHLQSIPLNIDYVFEDFACRFIGDERALSNEVRNKLNPNCSPFPSNYEMVQSLATTFKHASENKMKHIRF